MPMMQITVCVRGTIMENIRLIADVTRQPLIEQIAAPPTIEKLGFTAR